MNIVKIVNDGWDIWIKREDGAWVCVSDIPDDRFVHSMANPDDKPVTTDTVLWEA